MSLTDNMATITAYANDVSYDDIFLYQLHNFLKKDDVVLLDEIRKVRVGEHSDIKEDKEISLGFLIKKINKTFFIGILKKKNK